MLNKKNNSILSITKFPTYAGILTASVGFLVLIGWQFDITILKTVIPGTVSMKPNTAIGFILAGLSLLLILRSDLIKYMVVRFCSLIIIILGLLTLLEYFFGWNLGIDEFLFLDIQNAIQTSNSGRMSPNSALNFLFIGLSLFAFSFKKFKNNLFLLLLLILSLCISVISLLMYLTGFLQLAGHQGMAFYSSVSFIIICIGIICIGINCILNKDKNIPFSIEQKIYFGLTAVGSIIIFVSFLTIWNIQSLISLSKLLVKTHQIETNIQNLNSEVIEIVALGNMFLISGNEKYFNHWYETKKKILTTESTLNELELNSLKNKKKLLTLELLIKERIDYSELLITTYKTTGHKTSDTMLAIHKDKQISDKIDKIILPMLAEEDKLLTKITLDEYKQANRIKQVIFSGFSINVLFLLFIFIFFKKDITGRRKAEKKLKQFNKELEKRVEERTSALKVNEARLLKAQQIAHLEFIDWNLKTKTVISSNEIFKLFGVDKNHNQINLKKIFNIIHPDDLEYVKKNISLTIKNGMDFNIDNRILNPDGNVIWVNAQGHLQLDTAGNQEKLLVTIIDITKRKLREEVLRKSEEQLDLFFNQSLDGFFIRMLDKPIKWNDTIDKDKMLDYVLNHLRLKRINTAMLKQYGAKEKDFKGLTANELIFDNLKFTRQRLKNLFDKGNMHIFTKEKKKDGTEIIIEGDYICLYDSQKRIIGHFGIQKDVTTEHKSITEIKKLSRAVEQSPAMIFIADTNGNIEFINPKVTEFTGYTKDELIGKNQSIFQSGKTLKSTYKELWDTILNGDTWEGELLNKRKNGEEYWASERISPILNDKEEIINFLTIKVDISEKIKTQEEILKYQLHLEELVVEKTLQLTEQNIFLKTLLDTIPNPVFILNNKRKISLVNKSFENFFGIKRELILGKSISEIIPPDLEEMSKKYDKKLLKKFDSVVYESFIIINKSKKIPVMIFKSSYGLFGIRPQGITCLLVDISEQKKMEVNILSALNKEKELNEMKTNFISMASHEFRTPLTTILASADLLEIYHNKWKVDKRNLHIKKIQDSVLYMTSLLDDVLTMSRSERVKMPFKLSLINLEDFCREIIDKVKLQASPNHNFIYNFNLPYQNAKIEPKLLDHILCNLLINAIKYSPKGGDVVLSVVDMTKFIKFSIKDNGLGIPKDEINKLFEPFFRGKNSRNIEGTGLGLSIVKRYVELHNGNISLDSKLGKGTQFYVKIKKQ